MPDAELAGGTPSPAVIPIPGRALPPMASEDLPGYPFYIAGRIGHRPPQPPLDLEAGNDGGIGRHVITAGTRAVGSDDVDAVAERAVDPKYFDLHNAKANALSPASVHNARRVRRENRSRQMLALASRLETAKVEQLPIAGTSSELRAMAFHQGLATQFGGRPLPAGPRPTLDHHGLKVLAYPSCDSAGNCYSTNPSRPANLLFAVNSHPPKAGAPFADPCPADQGEQGYDPANPLLLRTYRASYIQFDMPVNRAGWHDPQARIMVLDKDVADTLRPISDKRNRPAEPFFFRANSGECVVFKGTNLMPSVLNLDDFQVYSPTDTIGQHIHLVKFDVTSSDGSANGWNYEDATFSPDETRERIIAANSWRMAHPGSGAPLAPRTHQLFLPGGALSGDPELVRKGSCGNDPTKWDEHPWCGAQTSIQRWWADPLQDREGNDRTIRTVFTHDHLGPSSHQHHGLYAALVVEPAGSRWTTLDGAVTLGGADAAGTQFVSRDDGGPTSFKANILTSALPGGGSGPGAPAFTKGVREFNLAFADYSILYTDEVPDQPGATDPCTFAWDRVCPSEKRSDRPVSPPNKIETRFPTLIEFAAKPAPEGISTKDPGSQLVNYRNEPIPLRIGKAGPPSGPGPRRFNDEHWVQRSDSDPACMGRGLKRYMTDPIHPERDPMVRLTPFGVAPPGTAVTVIPVNGQQTNQRELGGATFPEVIAAARKRLCDRGDMANVFSSRTHGDPATPILEGYQGDRVNIRMIQGAQEENHVFVAHGGNWLTQPDIAGSGNANGQQIGISEHFEFNIKVTSPQSEVAVTDYFYAASATDNLWDGQWGVLRAYSFDKDRPFLARLPDNPAMLPTLAAGFSYLNPLREVCAVADRDPIVVSAELRPIIYNAREGLTDPNGIVLIQEGDGGNRPRLGNASSDSRAWPVRGPLVLRMKAGQCLSVKLVNRLPVTMPDGPQFPGSFSHNLMPPTMPGFNFNNFRTSSRISLHPQLVATNGYRDDGSYIGYNSDSSCAADESCGTGGRRYRWYGGSYDFKIVNGRLEPDLVPVEFGVAGIQDFGDVIKHGSHGALGALVVEPADATEWKTDCEISPTSDCSNAAATVTTIKSDGTDNSFRELVLVYQDDASIQYRGLPLANVGGEDDSEDSGQRAFNYRMEPLWARNGGSIGDEPGELLNSDWSNILSSTFCNARPAAAPCPPTSQAAQIDPETPMLTAMPGIYTRIRLVHPRGHPRNHAFTLYGHNWTQYPWSGADPDGRSPWGSRNQLYTNNWSPTLVGIADGIGPGRHFNLLVEHAGGTAGLPGDYLYRSQDHMAFYSGQWGILRVPATCRAVDGHMIDADGHVCK